MDKIKMQQLLQDTAYIKTAGSAEEKRCADTIFAECKAQGLNPVVETYTLPMYNTTEAKLVVAGKEYPCKGYYNAGCGTVKAPLYYMPNENPKSWAKCEGKIVLLDGNIDYWKYLDLLKNKALGFIIVTGNANYADRDVDQRELYFLTDEERIPAVTVNIKDAIEMVANGCGEAELTLQQEVSEGVSQNIIVDLPGASDEYVLFSAHYDSTPLSPGVYDNMSSCIAQLAIAEKLAAVSAEGKLQTGVRFVWCGGEERGLLGSLAYCAAHKAELEQCRLNINLDMLGCIMGKFVGFTSSDASKDVLVQIGEELDFTMGAAVMIRSSDQNAFADCGVPYTTFARYAPANAAAIHCRYDDLSVMSVNNLMAEAEFIGAYAEKLVTAVEFPFAREIAEKIKNDIDVYFRRKRK